MNKILLRLAIACMIVLPPFSLNNFIQGRVFLGLASAVIVTVLAINAWAIFKQEKHYPTLMLFGLVPAVLIFLVFSLLNQGIIGVLWCYPAIISFYFLFPERKTWIASLALGVVVFPIVWVQYEPDFAIRIIASASMVGIFSAIFIRVITEQQHVMHLQAITDPLTGVLNRTLLNDVLDQAIQQNDRSSIPMSLIAFDLDHFKSVNDELGHDCGDAVLHAVGELLRARSRKVDRAFRLGGEEFLLFLYNTELADAGHVAEELRQSIKTLKTHPGREVTVSLGVAMLRNGENPLEWLKRSDTNLYKAKSAGRDRVVA